LTTLPTTQFDLQKALKVCNLVSQGRTYSEIFVGGDATLPTLEEFLVWSVTYPELHKAIEAARQLSAYVLEDEALNNARQIAKLPGTPQRVSAYKLANDQLRWSAERRNSGAFGQKGVQSVVVPVTIQTTLNLGQKGAEQHASRDIYELRATVPQVAEAEIEQSCAPEVPALPAGLRSAADVQREQETEGAEIQPPAGN
jgi:hypothetical protein